MRQIERGWKRQKEEKKVLYFPKKTFSLIVFSEISLKAKKTDGKSFFPSSVVPSYHISFSLSRFAPIIWSINFIFLCVYVCVCCYWAHLISPQKLHIETLSSANPLGKIKLNFFFFCHHHHLHTYLCQPLLHAEKNWKKNVFPWTIITTRRKTFPKWRKFLKFFSLSYF